MPSKNIPYLIHNSQGIDFILLMTFFKNMISLIKRDASSPLYDFWRLTFTVLQVVCSTCLYCGNSCRFDQRRRGNHRRNIVLHFSSNLHCHPLRPNLWVCRFLQEGTETPEYSGYRYSGFSKIDNSKTQFFKTSTDFSALRIFWITDHWEHKISRTLWNSLTRESIRVQYSYMICDYYIKRDICRIFSFLFYKR